MEKNTMKFVRIKTLETLHNEFGRNGSGGATCQFLFSMKMESFLPKSRIIKIDDSELYNR
jgi:hypothetical protein